MTKQRESADGDNAALYLFAEQLLDNPDQLAVYDEVKWNLIGSPDPHERREGRMPWLTRRDGEGVLRAYTLDVFSGFSTDSQSLLTIHKDQWRDPRDPATWLAMETDVVTGETVQHQVWSARVDTARQFWLQVANGRAWNQPSWYEHGYRHQAFRDGLPAHEQTRFTGRLDKNWQTASLEYRNGVYGGIRQYEDIVALESMLRTVQAARAAKDGELLVLAQLERPNDSSVLAA